MDFKRVYTSSKTYYILASIALVLLLFSTVMAYNQVMRMQKSAEMVTHSMHIYNGINMLTAHYTQADSEAFKNQLVEPGTSNFAFENYQNEGALILDSLTVLVIDNPVQIKRIQTLKALFNNLYNQLKDLDQGNYQIDSLGLKVLEVQKSVVSKTLFQIRQIKNEMLNEEQRLMQQRKVSYASSKSLAPLILLFLAFFALLVFVLALIRISKNKRRIRQSENFLKNVLGTTDNVINYYEPIFNSDKEITDFIINYANACNRDYFGLEPDDMIGKTVLEVFPVLKESANFNKLIACYRTGEKIKFNSKLFMNNTTMWFESLVTPLSQGILVTARNTTAEEEAKNIQLNLKKRLENQNLKLLDNRALLSNIFKSISHIVMHLKSIRNSENEIEDFLILFVNDRINPVTGEIPEDLKNKTVSEVYPDIFKSDVFNHLVKAIETNTTVTYDVPYKKDNKTHWFSATAIKLGDGVTITFRETTEEKEKSDELKQLNEQLVIRNSILSDAESIAKIGSFLWYVDSDLTELSENFYRILEVKPEQYKSTLKNFRAFVHPDDLELYDCKVEASFKGEVSNEYIYRIITKNGTIKHVKSNAQFLKKNGIAFVIGVVQDVSETILADEELRQSNLELKQSNAELDSFNRVASHDLQEPLRKIQLFISRIEDLDAESFSERTASYFEKVKSASQRMQYLIQNLLAYSRIDSSKSHLEHISLNHLMDKVLDDLATTIKETGTKIAVDNLPEINAVFFQMEQLFSNLISNAIKYRSKTQTPLINIAYQKVNASQVPANFRTTSNHYHKITVSDNGIGFDIKHAYKIFEVFQRLHQKTEYSGTGIGLAICKKIVENHNGYIHANGKIGEGSQFVVYLPIK